MATVYIDKRLVTLDNILNDDDISKLLEKANSKGWKDSAPSGGGHGRTGNELPRTSKFCVLDNESELAQKIFDTIKDYLPKTADGISKDISGSGWNLSFIMDRLKLYKYNVGNSFPEHFDYKMKRSIVKYNGDRLSKYNQHSIYTILVYLNDDFEGGCTGYYVNDMDVHCRFSRDIDLKSGKKQHDHIIIPTKGKCVIQDQNLLHEGMPVIKGTKYILRCDVIYEKYYIPHKKLEEEYLKPIENKWEFVSEPSCFNYTE